MHDLFSHCGAFLAGHSEFALEKLREVEAAPETEAEIEFRTRAVPTKDGKAMAVPRLSAVGRMRERMDKEKADRDAGLSNKPGWWPW